MKERLFDIYVSDNNHAFSVLARSTKSEKEANCIVSILEALGIDAVYGIHPDRIVNGKCVYDED